MLFQAFAKKCKSAMKFGRKKFYGELVTYKCKICGRDIIRIAHFNAKHLCARCYFKHSLKSAKVQCDYEKHKNRGSKSKL